MQRPDECVEQIAAHLQVALAPGEAAEIAAKFCIAENNKRVQEFLEDMKAGVPSRILPALKKEGRRTNHFHYSGTDWQPLMQALDKDWPGGVPHTILVAPDGKVLWRHTGELEEQQVIDRIVDALGPYFSPGERG